MSKGQKIIHTTTTTTKIPISLLIIILVLICLQLEKSTNFVTANTFPKQSTTAFHKNSRKKMAPKSKTSTDDTPSSSVLTELKETIQTQAKEIEQLKGQLTSTKATKAATSVSHGGGHGGGGGGEQDVAKYLRQPFYEICSQRVGWLGLFLSSLSMTALIMNVFEATLEKHIELAYFVPLLAGHGGNTGGQAVGTVLSALSAGSVKPSDAPRVVLKEAMAGAMSGIILGSIVSPIAYKVLGVSHHVAVVLFFTLPLVSMVASTLGSLIPFACVLLGLEPSVIAAPAMTSIVDVTGLMSYFLIANQIFKFYGLEL
jgi:cation transporter-like permease/uncharacterized small protein (DUF1192 family)